MSDLMVYYFVHRKTAGLSFHIFAEILDFVT